MWSAALAAVLVVGSQTRLGPTVFSVTTNHGVHLGDVLFGAVALVVALGVTVLVVQTR
jgi:hypothetical protein